jgi:hypothetical protein
MLLRTRVTLIVCLAFVALGAILLHASAVRERFADDRFAQATLSGLRVVWKGLVANRLQPIAAELPVVARDDRLVRATGAENRAAIALSLQPVLERLTRAGVADRIELYGRQGRLLYSSSEAVFPQPILDATLIERLIHEGGTLSGTGSDGGRGFVAAVALPLQDSSLGRVGVLTFAVDMSQALRDLGSEMGAEVLIVNRRGRILAGTAPQLWEQLGANQAVSRTLPVQTVTRGGRVHTITTVPIDGYSGADAARLITLQDTTQSHLLQRRVSFVSLAGARSG